MFSKQTSKLKTKSYKHRKKWLVSKVHDLKKQYDDILTAFKQRLDAVVNPVISEATRVLSVPDEEEFLKEVYDVGIGIEKCSNDLFEIGLFSLGENYFSDDESELSETDATMHSLALSSAPVSNKTKVCNSSVRSTDVCNTSTTVMSNGTQQHNSEKSPSMVLSEKVSNSAAAKSESPAFVQQNQQDFINGEIDLLLLHNIKIGEKNSVLVSDVISPSQFSVQPEESKEQLVDLQRELNALYSQSWTDQLKFAGNPKVGTICVALFNIDHHWYRAKILKEESNEKYEVIYIDYGNHNIVKKDDMRIIDPGFGNIPQLSIQCSLFGVEPALNKGEPQLKWSLPATELFDSQVFGKWFTAQFVRNSGPTSSPRYSVHLFIAKESPVGQTSSWSVADNLVCMGYAAFTTNISRTPVELENDKKQHKELSLMAHTPTAQRNLLKQLTAVVKGEVCVVPAGFESEWNTSNNTMQDTQPSSSNHVKNGESAHFDSVPVEHNVRRSLSSLTASKPSSSVSQKRLSWSNDQIKKL